MVNIYPEQKIVVKSTTIYWIIVASIFLHLLFYIFGNTILSDWTLEHYPVHVAFEFGGAITAIWVAFILYLVDKSQIGTSFNIQIANALIVMGVLDGLHSFDAAGQRFVYLHSVATFLGGLIFSSVCVNLRKHKLIRYGYSLFTIISLVLVIFSSYYFNLVPTMLYAGEFTSFAVWLNLLGGFFFLVSSVKLYSSYKSTGKVDDLLFCLHCILFSAAAIMFEQSQLWDITWWGWHILRFLAYGVAFIFIIFTLKKYYEYTVLGMERSQSIEKALNKKVSELTEELEAQNETLRYTVAKLEETNEDLNNFAHVAAHDLQSPLNSVFSIVNLMGEQELSQTDSKMFSLIKNSITQMKTLINDLLSYSKLNKSELKKELVDFNHLIPSIKALLGEKYNDRYFDIKSEKLPKVFGFEPLLKQLFQNIIENGLKYNKSEKPIVSITASENESNWLIYFKDNGIGIEEKYLETIFKPFERLHNNSEYLGTGIGLASCVRIAEKHSGKLVVESSINNGTTFIFHIPKL